MIFMKLDARNIIIGFAVLGAVALGTWNVLLQRENNYYQAAFQSEKKHSAKISEDNKREIEELRGRLIESDRKNAKLKEKIDKEVSELTMSLHSRNEQISDYKNRIKSYEENVDEIKDVLGDSVLFEKIREKIFVDTAAKETVFKELCDMFLNSSLNYLSKEIFPKQYILKTYKEEVKKKSLLNASKNIG